MRQLSIVADPVLTVIPSKPPFLMVVSLTNNAVPEESMPASVKPLMVQFSTDSDPVPEKLIPIDPVPCPFSISPRSITAPPPVTVIDVPDGVAIVAATPDGTVIVIDLSIVTVGP